MNYFHFKLTGLDQVHSVAIQSVFRQGEVEWYTLAPVHRHTAKCLAEWFVLVQGSDEFPYPDEIQGVGAKVNTKTGACTILLRGGTPMSEGKVKTLKTEASIYDISSYCAPGPIFFKETAVPR